MVRSAWTSVSWYTVKCSYAHPRTHTGTHISKGDWNISNISIFGIDQARFFLLCLPGMPFYQAVNILRRQDRIIKGVQVWYSDQVSITMKRWRFFVHVHSDACVYTSLQSTVWPESRQQLISKPGCRNLRYTIFVHPFLFLAKLGVWQQGGLDVTISFKKSCFKNMVTPWLTPISLGL